MSVATNSILKLLSDLSASADKIVEENASESMLPRISEWTSLIKNKARSIAESESMDSESGVIPSLTSFLKGSSKRGPRVSTVLTQVQKLHLHRKGKVSVKTRKSRQSSIKTPLRRKSDVKGTNEAENDASKLKIPPTVIKKDGISYSQHVTSSATSSERKKETPLATFTPVNGKGTTSKMKDRNSKRKSSSELSIEKVKKSKMSVDELKAPEREKSMQNAKVEKLMKPNKSSLLPNYANTKSSVGANAVVLKEGRVLRSKMETKQEKAVENRKNILALRQQKLQQNKRTREEKMEKTLQQRMILEKEKLSKLRSGTREKKRPNSSKEAIPKTMHKTGAENETLGETSNFAKSKEKEKQTSVKKLQMNKKTGTSVLKSNKKPSKKNQKHKIEKMNVTYIASGEQPSTSSKGNILKKANIDTSSETMKDVSNDNKPKTHTKGTKTGPKTKALFKQPDQPTIFIIPDSPIKKKGPESYAITPARSSFVSYDISEIRSDSEEEEQETNSKRIPSWATGVRLRNALLQQHHHPIDTDELFGNVFDPPDLAAIMGIKKRHYNKRTSSAVWNSSFS